MKTKLQQFLVVPPNLVLHSKADLSFISSDDIRLIILDAFIDLAAKNPNAFPLERLLQRGLLQRGNFFIGVARSVELGKKRIYLIPSINGMGITQHKVEFTCLIEANYVIV